MITWLYAASKALAPARETLSLAVESGFIWRSVYNVTGSRIARVKDICSGDDLILGFRAGGIVNVLARFRVGQPDEPVAGTRAFGEIPAGWVDSFRTHGYTDDPIIGALVGIFVCECEPLAGQVPYSNQNSLSRLEPDAIPARITPVAYRLTVPRPSASRGALGPNAASAAPATLLTSPHDGVHIGIDVGGRPEKGFDLCITKWSSGLLRDVSWKRVRHSSPLPPTHSLRAAVSRGDLTAVADATHVSAASTAAALWHELTQLRATGVYIDSPSAFARNCIGHGRLCEKRSMPSVSFQSTPSIACRAEHGGDWGWLVYGMVAFAACLHRGQLSRDDWQKDLEQGTFARLGSSGIIVRECFPTATISVLRMRRREEDVGRTLVSQLSLREVQAVMGYLKRGVGEVKRAGDSLYDRTDALVAALGALPHVGMQFREAFSWPQSAVKWSGAPGDDQIEGAFACVE